MNDATATPSAKAHGVANPFRAPKAAASEAHIVVLGTVETTGPDRCRVIVREVLRGEGLQPGNVLEVLHPAPSTGGPDGHFVFLDGGDPPTVIYAQRDRRAVVRLLAGLEASDPLPDAPATAALFRSVTAVIRGTAVTVDPRHAALEVYEVLKGQEEDLVGGRSAAGRVVVPITIADVSSEPGGPWTFTTDLNARSAGVLGTYFLDPTEDGWQVMNPAHPALVTPMLMRAVSELIGETP